MAAPPPDSDNPTTGLVPPPQLAVSPPPGLPGDQTLVTSPKDSTQPQATAVTPPPTMGSPLLGPPVNWAQINSPTDSPQRRSAQDPPGESNIPMGPVPPPPAPAEKLTADGIRVAAPIPADHPQPPETPTPQGKFSSWSSGLCDCRSDMDTCCLVFWCPCIAFGRMAEILDEGKSSCCCKGTLYAILHVLSIAAIVLGAPITFHFLLSYKYRAKLKRRLNLPPSCREDFCTHFWCEGCALCQEYHELQTRGYHLSLGWHGNMEKQRQARMAPTVVSPPTAPSMKR